MNRLVMGCFAFVVIAILVSSSSASANCTIGYWKNHPWDWCTDTLQLGDVTYNQTELLDILWYEVVGNGLVPLAHQLIGAKLNVSCGATPIDCMADADALIGGLVVPPIGTGWLDPAVTSPLIDCLTVFNETPGGNELCDTVPIESTRWGTIKAIYR
jgi:hypothetical protein